MLPVVLRSLHLAHNIFPWQFRLFETPFYTFSTLDCTSEGTTARYADPTRQRSHSCQQRRPATFWLPQLLASNNQRSSASSGGRFGATGITAAGGAGAGEQARAHHDDGMLLRSEGSNIDFSRTSSCLVLHTFHQQLPQTAHQACCMFLPVSSSGAWEAGQPYPVHECASSLQAMEAYS